ncbi:hypothetical protein ACA910_002586 [Epithemia clementina (nom. ined.)]
MGNSVDKEPQPAQPEEKPEKATNRSYGNDDAEQYKKSVIPLDQAAPPQPARKEGIEEAASTTDETTYQKTVSATIIEAKIGITDGSVVAVEREETLQSAPVHKNNIGLDSATTKDKPTSDENEAHTSNYDTVEQGGKSEERKQENENGQQKSQEIPLPLYLLQNFPTVGSLVLPNYEDALQQKLQAQEARAVMITIPRRTIGNPSDQITLSSNQRVWCSCASTQSSCLTMKCPCFQNGTVCSSQCKNCSPVATDENKNKNNNNSENQAGSKAMPSYCGCQNTSNPEHMEARHRSIMKHFSDSNDTSSLPISTVLPPTTTETKQPRCSDQQARVHPYDQSLIPQQAPKQKEMHPPPYAPLQVVDDSHQQQQQQRTAERNISENQPYLNPIHPPLLPQQQQNQAPTHPYYSYPHHWYHGPYHQYAAHYTYPPQASQLQSVPNTKAHHPPASSLQIHQSHARHDQPEMNPHFNHSTQQQLRLHSDSTNNPSARALPDQPNEKQLSSPEMTQKHLAAPAGSALIHQNQHVPLASVPSVETFKHKPKAKAASLQNKQRPGPIPIMPYPTPPIPHPHHTEPPPHLGSTSSTRNSLGKAKRNKQRATAKSCNCVKSRCLKLYCDCFNSGVKCGQDCGCESCLNDDKPGAQVLREQAQQLKAKAKDSTECSTSPTVDMPIATTRQSPAAATRPKKEKTSKLTKCTCTKTRCLKAYCECFAACAPCEKHCHCNGCENLDTTKAAAQRMKSFRKRKALAESRKSRINATIKKSRINAPETNSLGEQLTTVQEVHDSAQNPTLPRGADGSQPQKTPRNRPAVKQTGDPSSFLPTGNPVPGNPPIHGRAFFLPDMENNQLRPVHQTEEEDDDDDDDDEYAEDVIRASLQATEA